MLARVFLFPLLLAAAAPHALAQKPSDRGGSEQASGDAAVGWYQITTEGGVEMVQASEITIETPFGAGMSELTLDDKTMEIDLFRGITFHGLGGAPGDAAPMGYDSRSESSETTNNPDGSTTETKSTSTSKRNPDGSTTTTTSSSSTTTNPDGSTEKTDVVIIRTSPPTIR